MIKGKRILVHFHRGLRVQVRGKYHQGVYHNQLVVDLISKEWKKVHIKSNKV